MSVSASSINKKVLPAKVIVVVIHRSTIFTRSLGSCPDGIEQCIRNDQKEDPLCYQGYSHELMCRI